MGSSLDSLCWVVPNLLQPIIVLFHLLAATCMSDAYIYTIRGVEVSIGAMGYQYNKQPV